MKTRAQTQKEEAANTAEFTHQFFEEASKAWLANKEKYGQNMYRYKRTAFQEPTVLRKSIRLMEKQTKEN